MVDSVGSKGSVTRLSPIVPASPSGPVQRATREAEPDTASVGDVAAELSARPPVDEARVAEIKKALANGTFPILPATIADRLLALRYDWMSHDPQSF